MNIISHLITIQERKMDAAHLLLFCTLLVLFVQQSSGQAQKTPAEWDSRRADQFPNPLMNDAKCQVSSPMRICDPNTVLNNQSREHINDLLKGIEGLVISGNSSDMCLCNKDCPQPTVIMIVALMKCLSKDAHDQWVETRDIAEKFREQWKLHNCSVVLASAMDDKKYNLNPGKGVLELLTSNVTDNINNSVYMKFVNGELEAGIALTVSLYSQALNETAKKEQTTEANDKNDQTGKAFSPIVIIFIIVVVLVPVVVIIVVIIVIFVKYRKQKLVKSKTGLKGKESSGNKETETHPLSA